MRLRIGLLMMVIFLIGVMMSLPTNLSLAQDPTPTLVPTLVPGLNTALFDGMGPTVTDLPPFEYLSPTPLPTGQAAPQFATDGVFVVVAEPRVNVRTLPSVIDGQVVRVVTLGQRFPLIASNDDRTWWLIDIGGYQGWIINGAVWESNPQLVIPQSQQVLEPSPFQLYLVALQVGYAYNSVGMVDNVNIRRIPSEESHIVGRVPVDARAVPVGRNLAGTWLLVNYNGTLGWVDARLVLPPPTINLGALPVIP